MSLAVREPAEALVPQAPVRPHRLMRSAEMPVPFGWRAKSGDDLDGETIRLRLVGNPDGPAVLVLGGISAGRRVTSEDDGWWADLAGPGRVIDTDRYLVVGADYPPERSTRFRDLCPEDFASLLRLALDNVGIGRLGALVGCSFGGMIGLAFARLYPETVHGLAAVCAGHRPSAMASALRGIQRRILELTEGTNREADGVSLARQLAMTTYRTEEEFDARFSDRAEIDSYLAHCGRRYAEAVPSARYRTLSAAIDAHSEDPGLITVPTLVIASESDRAVPLSVTRELAAWLPQLAGYEVIRSVYGHDMFLKEPRAVAAALRRVLP